MDTFSSDTSRIMPVGINSQVIQGVPRTPVLKIPIPHLTKKQKLIKEIAESILRILNKIK